MHQILFLHILYVAIGFGSGLNPVGLALGANEFTPRVVAAPGHMARAAAVLPI